MTSAELIAKLKEVDPEGNLQVTVDNVPIYTVDRMEAYWDGRLQMLIQDPKKDPYYNIVGYKVTSNGHKIKLCTMNLEDVMLNDSDIPVDLSELGENWAPDWEKEVKETREDIKRIERELDEKKGG